MIPVHVAYALRARGATREIAEVVAGKLRDVDLCWGCDHVAPISSKP